MEKKIEGVDNTQLDVLKEIGTIGSGNAVTALAGLLNRDINMSVPEAEVVPFNDIVNVMNGPESTVAGMLVDMSGELSGYVLLVLDIHNAYTMVSMAMNEDRPVPKNLSAENFGDMELSVLTEVANILVGSYLSSIGVMTGLKITPSVPQAAIDMLGAIMSIAAIEYGRIGDSVLFMKTKFTDMDKEEMSGHFFLIPDYESYKILMKSL
ncbi:MAG: chemotaxis protein CheC, partial [Oscillospiraceae bacterium]|nr:chemotaxis protein CheC [Oscillospiraceae bacterium]